MTADSLPKYLQEANDIIGIIKDEPDHVWHKTQKEMAEELGIAPAVLSLRVKLLIEQGKIRRGDPLPMRGRNHALELVDPEPFSKRPSDQDNDRVLREEEMVNHPLELGDFSVEKIGTAVIQVLHNYWEKEERQRRLLRQHQTASVALRERLEEEHYRAEELVREKRELEGRLQEMESALTKQNRRIAQLHSGSGRKVLDNDDHAVLEALIG